MTVTLRKINVFSPSLIEQWKKDFIRDTYKFIRSLKLNSNHLEKQFEMNGEMYKFMGLYDGRDAVVQNISNGTMWFGSKHDIEKCILHSEKNESNG